MNHLELKDCLSIVAILISIYSLYKVSIINNRNYEKTAALKRLDHVLDINKILLANPALFTIYDDVNETEMPGSLLEAQREAMIDFILVTFENVLDDFKHNKNDEWKAWEASIDELFTKSKIFRVYVDNLEHRPIFKKDLLDFLKEKARQYKLYKKN